MNSVDIKEQFGNTIKVGDFIEALIIDGSTKSGQVTGIEPDYVNLKTVLDECWPLAYVLIKSVKKAEKRNLHKEDSGFYGYIIEKKIIRNGDELGIIKCCNNNIQYKFKAFNIKDKVLAERFNSFDKNYLDKNLVKFTLKKISPNSDNFGADSLLLADFVHDEAAKSYIKKDITLESAKKVIDNIQNNDDEADKRYGYLYSKNPQKNVGVIKCRLEDGSIEKYRLIAANILERDLLHKFNNYSDNLDYFQNNLLMFQIGKFENSKGVQECAIKVIRADIHKDEKANEICVLEKKYKVLDEQVNLLNEWMMKKGNDKDEDAYQLIQELMQSDNRQFRLCELTEKLLVLALRVKDEVKKERLDEVRKLLDQEKDFIQRETYIDSHVKIALTKLYDSEWSYDVLKLAIKEAVTIQKKMQGISSLVSYLEYQNGNDNKGRDKELVDQYVQYIENVRENPQLADGKSGQFVNNCLTMYTTNLAKSLRNIDEKNIDINTELYNKAKTIIEEDENAFNLYNGNDLFHCKISAMVSDILDSYMLPDRIREYTVQKNQNGQFSGNIEQIKTMLPSGGEKEQDCPFTPEEYLLMSSKMYYDLICSGSLYGLDINRTFCPNIAKYLTRIGDSIKLDNDSLYLDMARTYYLECINFSCYEYIWDNSVVQIILTHLATRTNWNNRYDRLAGFGSTLTNLDIKSKDTDCLIPSILGILDTFQSTRTIQKYKYIKNKIFETIFIPENISITKKVYTSLRKFNWQLPESCESLDELTAGFELVLEQYRVSKENFLDGIFDLKDKFSFSVDGLARARKDIKDSEAFTKYMLESDKKRFQLLMVILDDIFGYNSISDIKRIRILENAIRELSQLTDEIKCMPTLYSYMLIPAMVNIKKKAEEKLNDLYQDKSKYPKFKCYVVDERKLYKVDPDTVYIRIFVSNEEGCQNASNLKLNLSNVQVEKETDFSILQDERCINLYSGTGATFLIKLTSVKGFDISFDINIKYSYYSSLNNRKEIVYTERKQIVVSKEDFIPISNPYKFYIGGSAVQEESMFFGRKKLIDDILEQLKSTGNNKAVYGKTVVLYGQKRTGKSSVKYHLKVKLRQLPDTIIIDTGEISSFIDENFETEFFKTILNKLRREVKGIPDLNRDMIDKNIEIPRITSNVKQEVWSSFVEFYDLFSDYLKSSPLGKDINVFLIADEYTKLYIWLKQGKINAGFMEFWKSFFATSAISAIVVGQDYMPRFAKEYGNSFASMNIVEVTYLSKEAVREMMTNAPLVENTRIRADYNHPGGDLAIQKFMELTVGNAFIGMNLLDKLMDYLNETKRVQVTELEINCAMNLLLSRADIEILFNAFHGDDSDVDDSNRPEDNKTLLKQIAKAAGSECREEDIIGFDSERRQVLLKHLSDRKVVSINAKTGKYSITVKIYNEWLKRQ